MPTISRFYGITMYLYTADHPPPHVHARYAEYSAQIRIDDGEVLHGRLPPRALRLVRQWVGLHRGELWDDWERAQSGQPMMRIEPLP